MTDNLERFPARSETPRGEARSDKIIHYAQGGHLLELYRNDDGHLYFAQRFPDGLIARTSRQVHIGPRRFEPLIDALTVEQDGLLPPPPHLEMQDTRALFDDLLQFIPKHVSWSGEFLVGAAAYIMATWIYERFQFFGCLQFIGPPGTGKTRSLEVLEALCYHGLELSSLTAAVIFRSVSEYHPTLLIDEIDDDIRSGLREILRKGTSRRGKILRSRAEDYKLEAFRCYGPKVYGGQEPITDAALASRIIQENMAGVTVGPGIGPTLPEGFEAEARDLRTRLLRWALDNFWTIKDHPPGGADMRQQQVFLPLFTVAPLQSHPELRALMDRQGRTARREMEGAADCEVVGALRRMGSPGKIRPIEVAREVSRSRDVDFDRDVRNPERFSREKAGHALKRVGIVDWDRDEAGVFYKVKLEDLEKLYRTYLLPEPISPDAEDEPGTNQPEDGQ